MPKVIQHVLSMQYDGTNGSFIAGTWCTGITFVSDTGTVLTYKDIDNVNRTANVGEWLIISVPTDGYPAVLTNANYVDRFTVLPSAVALATGYALTPNIAGSGATANVAVDLDSAMSGTSYQATAVLAGTSALLDSLVITAVTLTDADTVTVTVQNNGLVALAGATVIVTAAELAD